MRPSGWALVTGASSGLGADFARELAARGHDLVLVARREKRLLELAGELAHAAPGVQLRIEALDLAAPGAVAALLGRLDAAGIAIEVLINNAGLGLFGPFLDRPWAQIRAMLELDMLVLSELAHRCGHAMVGRRRGWILNVSSIGAFQPTPSYAAYSAAKAYVLSLSEALARELAPAGVRVSALCPGITATEFLAVSGQRATWYQRRLLMRSADVVRRGLAGLWRGKPLVVPGLLNTLTVWSTRLIPRRWQAALAQALMRN